MESGHTIPQCARDLRLLLEELDLRRPFLLGWSMGAFVAWDLIRQFGTSSIGGLIVCDEAASDFKWPGFDHGFIDLPTLHELMTSVQDDRHAFLEGLVPHMFHRPPRDADLAWMIAECSKLSIGATAAILFDQSVQDYQELLPGIDVPTLVCWGRHDDLLAVSGAGHLGDHIPGRKSRSSRRAAIARSSRRAKRSTSASCGSSPGRRPAGERPSDRDRGRVAAGRGEPGI